jgi:putative flippase GtrA
MQKLKALTRVKKQELWEMIRYVVAGALTTLVSLIVSYGCYFLMAVGQTAVEAPAVQDGLGPFITWVIGVINIATTAHVAIGNVISWIVAVIFAFWINRWMVFRVKYTDQKIRFTAFFQFVSARVVSLLVFEVGLAALLNVLGTPNLFGRIIVLLFVMIFNYVASKFWVFKPNP